MQMRVVVVLLWLATGLVYCKQKEKCCDETSNSESMLEQSSEDSTLGLETSDEAKHFIIGPLFSKSSSELDSNYFNNGLAKTINDSLTAGRNIVITGYAYYDEESPEELAISRAASIRSNLDISDKVSSLEFNVMDTSAFKQHGIFANYRFVEGEEVTNDDHVTDNISISNVNVNRFKIYIDTLENGKLDEITISKLKEVAGRIGNGFCNVQLINAHENPIYGDFLANRMEQALIRYGMSPGRVNVSKNNDEEDSNYIELVVNQ